jgi:hypothetical protein
VRWTTWIAVGITLYQKLFHENTRYDADIFHLSLTLFDVLNLENQRLENNNMASQVK